MKIICLGSEVEGVANIHMYIYIYINLIYAEKSGITLLYVNSGISSSH